MPHHVVLAQDPVAAQDVAASRAVCRAISVWFIFAIETIAVERRFTGCTMGADAARRDGMEPFKRAYRSN
jgi:hypothetical protein